MSIRQLILPVFLLLFAAANVGAQDGKCTNGDCENGKGRYILTNGDKYIGEFKNKQPNGRGAYYFANGDIYKGEFKDGKRHGYGTMEWLTGDKYVGDYVQNQRQGDGAYYFADGRVKKGVFKQGVLVQEFGEEPITTTTTTTKTDSSTIAKVEPTNKTDLTARGGTDTKAENNKTTGATSSTRTLSIVQQFAPAEGIIEGEKRVALIFGNSAYSSVPLKNAANDADDIAARLRLLGFEVWLHKDAKQREMKQIIRDFGQYIKEEKAVGLFFYAGHGLQAEGRNYLIPVDADIKKEQDIEFEAVDLGRLFVELEYAENPMNIVILDACRDNPYKKEFGDRFKAHTGFTQIQNSPVNTMVAFSTAPGAVASDGAGKNGLYTQELLRTLADTPTKKLEDVFKQVRAAVRKASGGKQIPWENSSVETDFFFKKG